MLELESIQMRRLKGGGGTARWGIATTLGLLAGPALGCDAQADPTYAGEPLLTINGQVEAALTLGDIEVGVLWLTAASVAGSDSFAPVCTATVSVESEPSACVAACGEASCENLDTWEACIDACPDVTSLIVNASSGLSFTGGVGQTTPAVGEFPALFSLDILEPPPAEALIESTSGERLAYGVFAALDPAGAPWRLDLMPNSALPDWLRGGSESHALLYAPDGIPEGSTWAAGFGFTLGPGFQLVEPFADPSAGEGARRLRPVPAGDASQVRLTIAPPDSITWPVL